MQMHRSNKISSFSPSVKATPSGPATLALNRRSSVFDDSSTSTLYAIFVLIRRATIIRQETVQTLSLSQKVFKLHHYKHAQITLIVEELNEVYLDRLLLTSSTTKNNASDVYFKLLPSNHGRILL